MPMASARPPAVADATDIAKAHRLVKAGARRKRGMLAAYHDLDTDDLAQEGMLAVLKALPDYDPARPLSTFVGTVAGRRTIDLWRRRSRQARREADYAEAVWGTAGSEGAARDSEANNEAVPVDHTTPFDALASLEPEPAQTLAEWLRAVYLKAKRQCGAGRFRQGRRFHNIAQVVACAILMRKKALSSRGAVEMFKGNKELAASVRFMHVPDHTWFWRCEKVATDFLSRKSATN